MDVPKFAFVVVLERERTVMTSEIYILVGALIYLLHPPLATKQQQQQQPLKKNKEISLSNI